MSNTKTSVLSNLTDVEVQLTFENKKKNIKSQFTLPPNESCNIPIFEFAYEIVFVKINKINADVQFDIIVTSFMAILRDIETWEFYIHDFINNKKIKGNKSFTAEVNTPKLVSAGNVSYPYLQNSYSMLLIFYNFFNLFYLFHINFILQKYKIQFLLKMTFKCF